jgi:hypothetical protein
MARTAAVALALCALLSAQVVLAQYGNVARGDAVESRGKYNTNGDKFYVTSVTFPELKGVWQIDGMQMPQSQVQATEESNVPDCANDRTLFNYVGLDFDAPRFLVLAGTTGGVNVMNINQQRSTFSPNSTYAEPFIVNTNAATGAKSCTHFQPYVDVATGELRAESITMTIWTRNTTAGATRPIRSSPTCTLTGREKVGCYTGAVALGEAIQMAPAMAPTVAISSIEGIAPAAAAPAGSVTTVSRNTFACRQGECLRLSPKHSSTSPVYGG